MGEVTLGVTGVSSGSTGPALADGGAGGHGEVMGEVTLGVTGVSSGLLVQR